MSVLLVGAALVLALTSFVAAAETQPPQESAVEQKAEETVTPDSVAVDPAPDTVQTAPAEKAPKAKRAAAKKSTPADDAPAAVQTAPAEEAPKAEKAAAEEAAPADDAPAAVQTTPAAKAPVSAERAAGESAVTISRAVVAPGVDNREPVGAGTTFPASVANLLFFTHVNGVQDTASIEHRWYHNEQLVQTTVLPVRSPSWRTYSRRTFGSGESAGQWKVTALQAGTGEVLGTVDFTVE